MTSYDMGSYQISEDDQEMKIGFCNTEDGKEIDTKFKVLVFLIWGIVSFGLTIFATLTGSIAHGIIFFLVLVVIGFFLCLNYCKRSEVKYFSVIIDSVGVHEIWNDPGNRFQKTIKWEDLYCFDIFYDIDHVPGKSKILYDCILFSSENMEYQYRKKQIRRIKRSSMQYELKFREIPKNIFIIIESNGEFLYNEIIRFTKEKLNIDLKALLDSNSSRT